MSDDNLKPRSMKIGTARWMRWQAEARERGIPLTALIIERMEMPNSLENTTMPRDILGFYPGSAFQLVAECNGAAALIEGDTPNKRLFMACAKVIEELRTEIKRLRCERP